MKLLPISIAIFALTMPMPIASATPPTNASAIAWRRVYGKTGGGSDSVHIFSDGGSHIVVRRPRTSRKPNPGWKTGIDGAYSVYIKGYPFSIQEAKTKYSAAMAAGIDQLKSFPPQHPGGDVTAVTIGIRGQVTTVEIPEFYGKGKENNNIGSENHQRFLAVKKIVDDFDTDAFLLDSE